MHGSKPPAGTPLTKNSCENEPFIRDTVLADSCQSWPADPRGQQPLSSERQTSLDQLERDSGDSPDDPSLSIGRSQKVLTSLDVSPTNPPSTPKHPSVPRALSMPFQVRHLQDPCSSMDFPLSPQSLTEHSPEFVQFCELSLELAASVQMVVQTLLQVSPAQMLDPARELFAACSLPVPTSSISAVLTSLKNLNYMSANMAAFCTETLSIQQVDSKLDSEFVKEPNDFDIGELLQSVGDALSGAAANAGVDLVLFHGDVGIKHVSVKGDEIGLAFALSHIVRQVINTAKPGDSIEVGLFVTPASPTCKHATMHTPDDPALLTELEWPLQCSFDISHQFSLPDTGECHLDSLLPSRPKPTVQSFLLQRLLRHLRASLASDLQPKTFSVGRTCELTVTLDRGSPSASVPLSDAPFTASPTSDLRVADEPTLEELTQFAESLRGKKAMLYASSKGSFARHLTSYLTAWGLDVSHVSREAGVEGNDPRVMASQSVRSGTDLTAVKTLIPAYGAESDTLPSSGTSPPTVGGQSQDSHAVSFVLIDDDVAVLRERLHTFHAEQPHPFNFNLRRQSLTPNHRPRLSPQSYRSTGQARSFDTSPSVVIVHFTSLANFKLIKDIIHLILSPSSSSILPEVMIIPKPVGPRRFLTALHTAVTKPTLDPYFSPIATSPTSPGSHTSGSLFYSGTGFPKSPSHRPSGTRSNSERSVRSGRDVMGELASLAPPSPLVMSDSKDYFPETVVKLGNSPSSGLVIQSSDGQPAGILFHPRTKTPRKSSSASLGDRGQAFVPHSQRISSQGNVTIPNVLAVSNSPGGLPLAMDIQESQESQRSTSPLYGVKGRRLSSDNPSLQITSPSLPSRSSPLENVTRNTTPSAQRAISPKVSERRVTPKRPSLDKAASLMLGAPKKGKGPADANVVPPISVLIVDDNPINQTILSTFMKKKKINYDVAKNGQEAVQKWRTGGFHLILMDIQMPVMDGIQATKEIRRLEKANASAGYPPLTPQQTPNQSPSESLQEARLLSSPYRSSVIIVALTASSLQSDRVAALAAGCNDFLTKPVSLLWLNNKITEWGSIKALQMWADLRQDIIKSVSSGQAAHARSVAERLHLPPGRTTPSPRLTSVGPSTVPLSSTTQVSPPPAFWSPAQSPATLRKQLSTAPTSTSFQPPADILCSDTANDGAQSQASSGNRD